MSEGSPSPATYVQVMQALVARELVDAFGLPERQAAGLLGLVPSSVSQYLSGKRLGPSVAAYAGDQGARRLARQTAQRLMTEGGGARLVLEAAIALGELKASAPGRPREARRSTGSAALDRKVPRWLHQRIGGEQDAVASCMRLAQRSRDELTRALFRQIASDSLRHAEIVASLAAYLDRGVSSSQPTGITQADVEELIAREHAAEASSGDDLGPQLGGVMRILWESMEDDERKHERLLERLLEASGPGAPRTARSRRRPRSR